MATIPDQSLSAIVPQPAWEVAFLFPNQGHWSEFEYLALDTRRLVELIDGNLKVLPMPTFSHQQIVVLLFEMLKRFITKRRLGIVLIAPLPMRIRDRTYREPDVVFFSRNHLIPPDEKYLHGANLVIEVVSDDDESHKRDYDEKRVETEGITVLTLSDKRYQVHGEFAPGQLATSVLLDGFSVDVSEALAAGRKLD